MSREGHACEAQGPRPPGGAGRRSPGWTGSVGGLEAGVGGGGYGSRRGWPPGSVGCERACKLPKEPPLKASPNQFN